MSEAGRDRLLLALVLVAFFVAGLVILPVPFTRDQGIYAYMGWRWLGDAVPYRDAFGHKGPLLYALYALGLKLSGGAMWGINLLDLLTRTATIALVYITGRELMPKRAAVYAAIFTALPLFGIFNSCWWNAQAETFMMPLLVASTWLCVRKWKTNTTLLVGVAGFIAAQAVMLKPTALLHAVFLFTWCLAGHKNVFADRLKSAIALGAGIIVGIAPWIIYFAAKGALGHMWESLVVFNSFHASAGLEVQGATIVGNFFHGFWAVFYLIPAAIVFLFLKAGDGERPGRVGFILCWALACLFMVLVQARFFLYHWLVLIPAMGLGAGAGMNSLRGGLARWRGSVLARAAIALVLVWFTLMFGRSWYLIAESYRTRDYIFSRITLTDYYARFSEGDETGKGDFNLMASAAAAHYLRERTDKDSRVLVFGYEPIVNYLAARPAPTRFQIDYPLTFTPRSPRAEAYRQKWRAEFMADLKTRPPEMVVILDNDINAIEPKSSIEQAREFDEFRGWLKKNYSEVDVIEDFRFYKRHRQ